VETGVRWICEAEGVCAVSICSNRNFRVATVRPESLISLMWLSYMSEILTCPAITNRSEKPGLPIK